jgi:chromosome segregation ATPase
MKTQKPSLESPSLTERVLKITSMMYAQTTEANQVYTLLWGEGNDESTPIMEELTRERRELEEAEKRISGLRNALANREKQVEALELKESKHKAAAAALKRELEELLSQRCV